jgi:DNA-binding beta-propeller fold protein YncE
MGFRIALGRRRKSAGAALLACIIAVAGPRYLRADEPAAKSDPPAKAESSDEHPFKNRQKAPAIEGGVGWLNTPGPIDLKDLRGKFVLLDFWTYCCINCMHILPNLKQLEHAYPNEIVVIGVHSAKFAAEEDSKNIEDAIKRYEIEHPVVNDAHHKIWDAFQVQSWPTLMVIDPEGNLVAANSGEVDFETLDKFFKRVMPYYKRKGLLDATPLKLEAKSAEPDTPLRYPGKLLADEKSGRLFIADSNHNRIVVTKLDGTLIEIIGNGQIGAAGGSYAAASFNHPQGMALTGDVLYVADTENHLIRKVDLKKQVVETIAGTGKQGHGWPGMDEFKAGIGARKTKFHFVGPPLKTALNSPWALYAQGRELYVAMAGAHQIWRLALGKHEIGPYAGNGREDIVDGPLLPPQPYEQGFASFAQPSGLSSDGKTLYVADSEGSSIRAVPLDANESVHTVVGTSWLPNGRLFAFGDVDGQGRTVRLQHALDVLLVDGLLYVADTYNNKIKVIDPNQSTCKSLAGTGKPGHDDNPASFDEPAGLAYAAGKLYVADTNNHRIRTIDLKHGNQVATLEIKGLQPATAPAAPGDSGFADAQNVDLPSATIKSVDGKARLRVALELPQGFKLNNLAPVKYLVESDASDGPIDRQALGKAATLKETSPTFNIELPVLKDSGSQKLKVSLAFYYCQEGDEGVCKAASVIWTVPLALSPEAANSSVRLPFRLE